MINQKELVLEVIQKYCYECGHSIENHPMPSFECRAINQFENFEFCICPKFKNYGKEYNTPTIQ